MNQLKDGWHDLPAPDYHKLPAMSSGAVKELTRSPAHCHYYMHDAEYTPPTTAQILGSAFHSYALEYHRDKIATLPDGIDRRTKVGKAAYAEFTETNKGKTIINAEQFAQLQGMMDVVARQVGSLRDVGQRSRHAHEDLATGVNQGLDDGRGSLDALGLNVEHLAVVFDLGIEPRLDHANRLLSDIKDDSRDGTVKREPFRSKAVSVPPASSPNRARGSGAPLRNCRRLPQAAVGRRKGETMVDRGSEPGRLAGQ